MIDEKKSEKLNVMNGLPTTKKSKQVIRLAAFLNTLYYMVIKDLLAILSVRIISIKWP